MSSPSRSRSLIQLDGASRKGIQAALRARYQHSTVPAIFAQGEFLGGCEELVALKNDGGLSEKLYGPRHDESDKLNNMSGDLDHLLATRESNDLKGDLKGDPTYFVPDEKFYDVPETPPDAAYRPLFYFPEVVESNTIRLIGLQVVIVLILGIIWRQKTWSHYMILGLAVRCL